MFSVKLFLSSPFFPFDLLCVGSESWGFKESAQILFFPPCVPSPSFLLSLYIPTIDSSPSLPTSTAAGPTLDDSLQDKKSASLPALLLRVEPPAMAPDSVEHVRDPSHDASDSVKQGRVHSDHVRDDVEEIPQTFQMLSQFSSIFFFLHRKSCCVRAFVLCGKASVMITFVLQQTEIQICALPTYRFCGCQRSNRYGTVL